MKFLGRGVIAIFSIVVFCGLIIWLFSPLITRPILGNVLEDQGLILDSESSIRLNPFSSHLTIHNLAWQAQNNTVFNLDELSVKYSLSKLIVSNIYISEIKVDGVRAKLMQSGDSLTILGVALAQANNEETVDNPSEAPPQQTEPTKIVVELVEAKFTDIQLEADINGQTQQLNINEFELNSLSFDGNAFSGTTSIDIALNPSMNDNNTDDATAPGTRNKGSIPHISMDTKASLGFVGHITPDLTIELNDITLTLKELSYDDDTYQATLEELALLVPHVKATLGEEQKIDALISLETANIAVLHNAKTKLVNIQDVAIPNVKLDLVNNILTSSLDTIEIADATFLTSLNNASNDEKSIPLTSFERLTLSSLSVVLGLENNDLNLALESILLDKLSANIEINQNGDIDAFAFLSTEEAQNNSTSEELKETPPDSNNNLEFNLGAFSLSSPASIRAVDHSVAPVFTKNILIETLNIENINNTRPEEEASFVISLKDDEYFTYNISGKAQPFLDKLNLTLNSDIKQLAVNEISPYLNSALGFGVDAGQLDSDVVIEVVEDNLDGTVKINLRGASFSSNKAKQDDELDMVGQAAIPLNVALNMLKDSDGNIKLTIPVDGDITDPSFGVQYLLGLVVKKAVMNQTKKHLVNTFIPYGQILSVAYSAGTYALKVRFEDLVYTVKQTEINDSQNEFIEQFSALLIKKESLQVKLCPIATVAELDTPVVDKQLSKEQRQQLTDLATARAAEFKRTVTEKGGDSARLLVCSPEIDFSEKGLPRINFST